MEICQFCLNVTGEPCWRSPMLAAAAKPNAQKHGREVAPRRACETRTGAPEIKRCARCVSRFKGKKTDFRSAYCRFTSACKCCLRKSVICWSAFAASGPFHVWPTPW
jgi:hypothetical protein